MKKRELEEMIRNTIEEMSTTGGTANATAGTGEQTFEPLNKKRPKLETKDKEPKLAAGKVKDNYAVSHFGFTPAPSVPNRKSGMIDYKQLFEKEVEESRNDTKANTDMVVAALNSKMLDKDVKVLLYNGYIDGDLTAQKVVDLVKKLTSPATLNEILDETLLTSVAEKLKKLKSLDANVYEKIMGQINDYILDLYPHDKEIEDIIDKEVQAADLKLEENYSRFRSQTGKRSGPEQLHTAVREIKKKLAEVDRLLEYTERLKSELTEGNDGFKYKVHTERALEQITEMIKHTYMKSKKLK